MIRKIPIDFNDFFIARASAHAPAFKRHSIPAIFLMFFLSAICAADDSTIDSLILKMDHRDARIRLEAAEILRANQIPGSGRLLARRLASEKDAQVLLAMLDALGKNGAPEHVPQIAPLLNDSLVPIRKRAAYVIGILGGSHAETALGQALEAEPDAGVKAMIAQSLSICGSSRSVPHLQKALSDSRPEVRAKAVEALRYIPGQEAQTALESARSDRDKTIRRQVDQALKKRSQKRL